MPRSRAGNGSARRSIRPENAEAGREWAEAIKDSWDPCILALDGGGIRGYSSLLILRALMHEVHCWELELHKLDPLEDSIPAEEDLLPCHYFDFIYGTSTGGLIATMLSRLRMSIEECMDAYREVGDKLFGTRRSRVPMRTKYHHEPLEEAVQKFVSKRCIDEKHKPCDGKTDWHPWQYFEGDSIRRPSETLPLGNTPYAVERSHFPSGWDPEDRWDPELPRMSHSCCLTAIHNSSVSKAHLLRSYPHFYVESTPFHAQQYNEGADMLRIWEVTRATSAAPFYFKMLEAVVEDNDRTLKERVYKDGGIRENNPSHAAWVEFQSLYEGMRENPALLLSIGTGRADQSQDGFATSWPGPFRYFGLVRRMIENLAVIRSLLVKYTESEHTHVFMRDHAKGEHTWYKRLNVTTGLEDMPLDHWVSGLYQDSKTDVPGGATLTRMEVETAKYLDRAFDPELDDYAAPRVMLRQAAEKLVRQRRARAKEGGLRWQTFIGKAPLHVSVNGFAA